LQHRWAGLREEKEQMLVFKKHKMTKFTLVILLFLGSVCNAADNYYVATNGWDFYTPTQAQNPATPWHTIQHALDTITSNNYIINLAAGTYDYEPWHSITLGASKNGKTIVFLGASSDANATIFSSSTANAFVISSCTTGNITWQNMTIKSTYAGNKTLVSMWTDYDGVQLTFNNCILGVNGDTTTGYTICVYFGALATAPTCTRKITFIDSYCYGKDNIHTVWLRDIGTLTINNSLIDRTNSVASTSAAILLGNKVGTVTINNGSIIRSKVLGLYGESTLTSFAKCEIDNVTFDCNNEAVSISDYLVQGTFTNITANNGIVLGHIYNDCSHPLGQIVVHDNNLIHTAADINAGVFGLAIGYGITGAEVYNNNVLDFGIALSLKGTACNIHHNIFRGGSNNVAGDFFPIYLRSANHCLFEHNTVYALGRYALYLYDQDGFPPGDANHTDYNVFVSNIFDASGGGTYAIYLKGPEIYHNLFDYNCYVAGSTALGYAGGANKTLTGLRMWWATNAATEQGLTNDSHSIAKNPQFMDPANGDFRLDEFSPCLNTGERTLYGGYTSMGAWQPPSASVIFGYVSELDGNTAVEGVLIRTDGNDVNTVTDANGFYELWVDYNWSGIVTPQKEGYVFKPDSNTYTNVTQDYGDQNYIATLKTFVISGYVLEQNYATPINDVNVSAENGGGPWTSRYGGGSWLTDANGYYEVVVDYNWSGKVTPTKYTYGFTPANIDYNNVIADQNNQNYNGKPLPFIISGYIKNGCDVPIAGVLVDANNGGGQRTTDANGYYEVWVDYNWSGTVTPTKGHHTFNPGEMVYVDVLANQTEQNYQATNIYDLDCNGSIGFGDIRIISENWLNGPYLPGDFYKDEDDIVNFLDFAEFAKHWLEGPIP
jgi:hypothetical protein